MPSPPASKLVIAISSRALFNLDESHLVYEEEGLKAYSQYQIEREDEPLEPGEAFPLVHKLLRLNDRPETKRIYKTCQPWCSCCLYYRLHPI